MKSIIKLLEKAGRDGINLISGDGAVRCCYPILVAYVGDYPEQLLVSIVKSGNCPICPAPCEDIENWDNILEPCNTGGIITALNSVTQGATKFTKAYADESIKPVQCVFGKIYHLSISIPPSCPTFCISYFKGSSNTLFSGYVWLVAMLRLMPVVVAYLKITTSNYS